MLMLCSWMPTLPTGRMGNQTLGQRREPPTNHHLGVGEPLVCLLGLTLLPGSTPYLKQMVSFLAALHAPLQLRQVQCHGGCVFAGSPIPSRPAATAAAMGPFACPDFILPNPARLSCSAGLKWQG